MSGGLINVVLAGGGGGAAADTAGDTSSRDTTWLTVSAWRTWDLLVEGRLVL